MKYLKMKYLSTCQNTGGKEEGFVVVDSLKECEQIVIMVGKVSEGAP